MGFCFEVVSGVKLDNGIHKKILETKSSCDQNVAKATTIKVGEQKTWVEFYISCKSTLMALHFIVCFHLGLSLQGLDFINLEY